MKSKDAPKRRVHPVLQALKEHGPLDVHGIAAATDIAVKDATSMVRQLRRCSPPPLHIHAWVSYGRAIYKCGQGADATRPPPIHKPRPRKRCSSKPLLPPRLQIPAAPMPPLAWMTTQPPVQMSARW